MVDLVKPWTLRVKVLDGRNLAVRDPRNSDPYVVLNFGDQNKKTAVKWRSSRPQWNESFDFDAPPLTYGWCPPLKVEVWNKETFARDDFVGCAAIDVMEIFSGCSQTGPSEADSNPLAKEFHVRLRPRQYRSYNSVPGVDLGALGLKFQFLSKA